MTAQPEAQSLAAWILEQVEADEAAAMACAEVYPPPWDVSDRGHSARVTADEPNFRDVTTLEQSPSIDGWLGDRLHHIARHDPARVLAQCAAIKAVVALHAVGHDSPSAEVWGHDARCDECQQTWPCQTLVALAGIWGGHDGAEAGT